MKRCITAHTVDAFGDIPLGSLWPDDSPFLLDEHADCFEDVVPLTAPEPATSAQPVRKFGAKKAATPKDGE